MSDRNNHIDRPRTCKKGVYDGLRARLSPSQKAALKESSGVNFQYSSNDRSFLYNCPVVGIQHSGVFVAHLLCGEGGVSVLGEVIGAVGMPENIVGPVFPIHRPAECPALPAEVHGQQKAGLIAAQQKPFDKVVGHFHDATVAFLDEANWMASVRVIPALSE